MDCLQAARAVGCSFVGAPGGRLGGWRTELRFLNQIVVFLYPIGVIALAYIISLLVGFNSSVFVLGSIYFPDH